MNVGVLPVACVALLVMLTMVGCRSSPDPPRWNVILLLVDTLRADRMGLYGYGRDTTPELERFADDAVVFLQARSQSGCTFPSVNSLLTSRHPQRFLLRPEFGMAIPEDTPTVAEILKEAGYATGAVSASVIVRRRPSKINRQGGFDRGFDKFLDSCRERRANCVNQQALELLDELPEPFFLYLHYLEPHAPYRADRARRGLYATHRPEHPKIRQGFPAPIRDYVYENKPLQHTPEDVEHLKDLYDEEVASIDARVRELLTELEQRGLLDRSIVVLAADHGEEFLEHNHVAHCRNIAYDTVLHTPLLISVPEGPSGTRKARVQNLDIVPTVLDYLGLTEQGKGLEGRSLRPTMERDRPVHRRLFASQGVMRVIYEGDWKLILDTRSGSVELYDLSSDPEEQIDRATEHPAVVGRLRESLETWIAHVESGLTEEERLRRSQLSEDELRALGYL